MAENPDPNDMTRDREGAPPSRIKYLESILRQAINPEALKELVKIIGFERTIINVNANNMSSYACFRIEAISGQFYILCPIPFFYDEERMLETGFAIDVDQDYFIVYPYMFNYTTKESIIISRLPHCVHKAITVDAKDYASVSNEIKEISNEASAIFFINNLLNDFVVGIDAPVEFFDDKLYLQLIERILDVKEKKWMNAIVVEKKFDQVMRQLEDLDEASPLYENNRLRVYANIARFMFGFEGGLGKKELVTCLAPSTIQKHEQAIYTHMLSKEFFAYMDDKNRSSLAIPSLLTLLSRGALIPPPAAITNVYTHLRGKAENNHEIIGHVIDFMDMFKIPVDPAQARYYFGLLLEDGRIEDAEKLGRIFGKKPDETQVHQFFHMLGSTPPSHRGERRPFEKIRDVIAWTEVKPDHSELQLIYEQLFRAGLFCEMKDLAETTGVGFDESRAEEIAAEFSNKGFSVGHSIEAIIKIIEWTRVRLPSKTVEGLFLQLIKEGDMRYAKSLAQVLHVEPSIDTVRSIFEHVSTNGFEWKFGVESLRALMEWTAIIPDSKQVQQIFFHLLKETRLDEVKKLTNFTGTKPDKATLHAFFEELPNLNPTETVVNAVEESIEISGFHPDHVHVQRLFKTLLASGNVSGAIKLEKITGVPLDPLILRELYAALARDDPAYQHFSCENFLAISEWSKVIPDEGQLRDLFIYFITNEPFSVVRSTFQQFTFPWTRAYILKVLITLAARNLEERNPIQSIREFISWAGTRMDEQLVHEAAIDLLSQGKMKNARILAEAAGIKLSEGTIRDFFKTFSNQQGQKIPANYFPELIEWTGIHPEHSYLQDIYIALFKDGLLNDVMRLHEMLGVLPDAGTIQAGYCLLMDSDAIQDPEQAMAILEAWSGIIPSKDTIKRILGFSGKWSDVGFPREYWLQKKFIYGYIDDLLESRVRSSPELEEIKARLKRMETVAHVPLRGTIMWLADVFIDKIIDCTCSRNVVHLGITDPVGLCRALNLGLMSDEEKEFLDRLEHVTIVGTVSFRSAYEPNPSRFTRMHEKYVFVEGDSLDASHLFLSSTSDMVGIQNLIHLETLYLSHNDLTDLDKSIKSLYRLKKLYANDNSELSEIPCWIDSLRELEEIVVSNSNIASLPDSFFSLVALKRLDISQNKLGVLPEEIGRLHSLEEVDVHENKLRVIPESIVSLTSLRVLDASHNQIESMPGSLRSLTKLETLHLASNELEKMVDFPVQMPLLRDLDVGENNIDAIPESIGNLQALEIAGFNNNHISSIPEAMAVLLKLRILDLSKNDLVQVPRLLSRLPSLASLDLRENKIDSIPDDYPFPSGLKILRLEKNLLHRIPACLQDRKQFINIAYEGNPIDKMESVQEGTAFDAVYRRFKALVTRFFESDELKAKINGNTAAIKDHLASTENKLPVPIFCTSTVFILRGLRTKPEGQVDEPIENVTEIQQRLKNFINKLLDDILVAPGEMHNSFMSSIPVIEIWMGEYENGTKTGAHFFRVFVIQILRNYLVELRGASPLLVEQMLTFDGHDDE
nr:leucine-rich repeat domain-containing protein [Candidatus Sigynarchaeum springense]